MAYLFGELCAVGWPGEQEPGYLMGLPMLRKWAKCGWVGIDARTARFVLTGKFLAEMN